MPGVFTPNEAFTVLEAGATALKLFPAEGVAPAVLSAMRAILPKHVRVLPVGGITPHNAGAWLAAGAAASGSARPSTSRAAPPRRWRAKRAPSKAPACGERLRGRLSAGFPQ